MCTLAIVCVVMADLFLFFRLYERFQMQRDRFNLDGTSRSTSKLSIDVMQTLKTGKLTLRLVTVLTVPKHLIIGSMLNATT